MDTLESLGKILTGPAERDAVHIAVLPAVAGSALWPGCEVGLSKLDGSASEDAKPHIGIVDPFLKKAVEPGQRFWIYLYPGSITSLKHAWTHPVVDQPLVAADHKAWLKAFADEVGVSYKILMQTAASVAAGGDGHYLSYDTPEVVYTKNAEFWTHYGKVTGTIIQDIDREGKTLFHCSC